MDPRQRVPHNQATPLIDYNVVADDAGLRDAVRAYAGDESGAIIDDAMRVGELAGSAEAREHWHRANENPPVMHTVDRFGQRIDEVDFHPSWHWLMRHGIGFGLGATAWTSNTDQAHLRRAASYIAWGTQMGLVGIRCPGRGAESETDADQAHLRRAANG